MASPSFVAASTGATDAGGAWVATSHAPGAAGRVIILQVLQDGATNGAVTFTSATNIENLAGTDNQWTKLDGPNADDSYPVGGASEARQHLWIGRSLSTSAPTFTGGNSTSEDLFWRFYEFLDVSTGTTLATVLENVTAGATVNVAGTSATASPSRVRTLERDRLALNFVAVNDDNPIGRFADGGSSIGIWNEVAEYADSAGTDGAIQLQWNELTFFTIIGGGGVSSIEVGDVTPRTYVAQSFVAPDATLRSLAFELDLEAGAPTDDLIVELRSDSSGLPSASVLRTVTFTDAQLPSNGKVNWLFAGLALTHGTRYWLVFRRSGAVDGTNHRRLFGYAGIGTPETAVYTSGDGSSWAAWTPGVALMLFLSGSTNTPGDVGLGDTASITDSDPYGVVGFALIGTTDTTRQAGSRRAIAALQAVHRAAGW